MVKQSLCKLDVSYSAMEPVSSGGISTKLRGVQPTASNLLFCGVPRILPRDSSRNVKLTIHLLLALWLGTREVLSPFTAWRLIKHRGNFFLSQRIMFRSVREPRTVSSHPADGPVPLLPPRQTFPSRVRKLWKFLFRSEGPVVCVSLFRVAPPGVPKSN